MSDPTAAVLVIGNEVLSGRTQDVNVNVLARKLGARGIRVWEARIVADITDAIVAAVNELRARYTYVFTTGGIGPTHDDITTEAIAVAFGVPVVEHPEARARLQLHYGDKKLNAARLRMACVPEGATLIDNPVSAAPGFRIGNVHVLAGVPRIMEAMLDGLLGSLCVGAPRTTVTISGAMKEGDIAEALGGLALGHPTLEIGSYPWFRDGVIGTVLVVSGTDRTEVLRASDGIIALARAVGVEPDVR